MKYAQNLRVEGNKVFSYNTHVATIEGNQLVKLGYWSTTTSKHINHVADEYGLKVVEQTQEQKEAQRKEEEASAAGFMKMVGTIAQLGEIFATSSDNTEEQNKKATNDWKSRMLKAGLSGLSMPEDWDTLSEEEKERRLDGVITLSQAKPEEQPEKWLADFFRKGKELNDAQRASLSALLGSGCREANKRRVRSICHYGLDAFRGKWFAGRLYFIGDVAHYCAGQSYPDEIRSIRNEIMRGR